MKNTMRYIAMVTVSFAVIFSAFVMPHVIAEWVSSARSRAYWAERQRQDYERNLYLMAQLLETKAAVIAAMEARPHCVYVGSMIVGPYIPVTGNRIVMETRNLSQRDFQDVVTGFRQYVYDSEMIMIVNAFELCLGGGQGSYVPVALLSLFLAVIAAAVMYSVIERRKARRMQKIADDESENEAAP